MSQRKQGDTQPPIVIDCFTESGTRPPLDTAQSIQIIVTQKGVLKWQRTVTGDANGTVTVPIQASDVATVGTYSVKIFVRWPDGTQQHYPPADKYLTFTVTR